MHLILAAALLAATPDAAAEAQLGKTLFQQGKLDEAIGHFQRAVELRENDATAWYNLAYATRKAQRFPEAARAYKRYTELAPDDPDGYFGLAESLRQIGSSAEAVVAYQQYVARENRASEQKWVELSRQRITELKQKPAAPTTAAANPPAANPNPNPSARTLIANGDKAFAARDFRNALFAYQDAIRADPKNVEALLKAGRAYFRLGHDDEAIEQWTRVLKIDPQNAAAVDEMAAAHTRKAALAPQPTAATAAPPAALPPLPPADEPGARAHYTRGVGLVQQRQFDQAVAELDQALALKPGWAVALIARGSARIGQGRYQDAAADYSAAQTADPSLAAPLFGLAEAYRGMGDAGKAVELYRKYAQSTAPDAQQSLKDYALQAAQALAHP